LFDVSRTAIELFGLQIHWYGVLIALGTALGVLLARLREERVGVPPETTLNLALVCIPAALVGARLYFVAFSWEMYSGSPMDVFKVWEGGMAIYGGVLGGLLAGWIYSRVRGESFLQLADLAAPGVALGQAIGRWGNFVNQEAYGAKVTDAAFQFYPAAVQIGGEWYYATFFYESMWCLVIVAVLLTAERRKWTLRRGDVFFGYAFLYGAERAVVEGLRMDSLYIGPLRVSQMLSLAVVLAVAVLWAKRSENAPRLLRVLAPCGALAALATAASRWSELVVVPVAGTIVLTLVMIGMEVCKRKRIGAMES